MRTLGILPIAAMAGLLASGCDVSPMYRDRQSPPGPVSSPGSSKAVDQTKIAGDVPSADADEVDLVEALVKHRASYHRSLQALHDYYRRHGLATKSNWAEFELKGLQAVKAFQYLADAEVPSGALKASASIAEADALYERGLDTMKKARQGLPGNYHRDLMVEAAGVLRELIEKYPTSDKIDDAAFELGVIHKEYLPDQDTLAVTWFERAYKWDPNTPHPARFEAAVVCDYRLHDRVKALELYHRVVKEETRDSGNVRHATRRIDELSDEVRSARAGR